MQSFYLCKEYCSHHNSVFGGKISSYEGKPSSKSVGADCGTDATWSVDISVVEYGKVWAFGWIRLDTGSIWVNLQKEHGMQLYIPFKQTHALSTSPKPPILHKISPRSTNSGFVDWLCWFFSNISDSKYFRFYDFLKKINPSNNV